MLGHAQPVGGQFCRAGAVGQRAQQRPQQLQGEIAEALQAFLAGQPLGLGEAVPSEAAEYLVQELAAERIEFVFSKYAKQLQEGLKLRLQGARMWDDYQRALANLDGRPAAQWALAANWLRVAEHFDLLLDRPEAVDALEQTILQLAVRGLLVPQDPRDEPADELLARVRADRAAPSTPRGRKRAAETALHD